MATYNERAIEISQAEFEDTINSGNKISVVDFYAEWCMPCLMIAPIIEELACKFEKIKFARVNVDENQELSEKLKVSAMPCIILFANGKEVERIIGCLPEEVIEEKISKVLVNKVY